MKVNLLAGLLAGTVVLASEIREYNLTLQATWMGHKMGNSHELAGLIVQEANSTRWQPSSGIDRQWAIARSSH